MTRAAVISMSSDICQKQLVRNYLGIFNTVQHATLKAILKYDDKRSTKLKLSARISNILPVFTT